MILYSTSNRDLRISFRDSVIKGLADDGGLYMPLNIKRLPESFFMSMHKSSFTEIAFRVADALLENEIPSGDLKEIIESCMDFRPEMRMLEEKFYVLELFHGPTLAFKDFGARFMAGVLSYFNRDNNDITVLVATSGDTGSAVANGFHNVKGIKVVLLYPSGRVSLIQEQQLTTLGGNITAVEVNGSFDDCQSLVKRAFADRTLREELRLTSANSINIARLIPQSFYYYYAYSVLKKVDFPLVFSVPSGNLGNLTGGLIAMRMGLPVHKFIAAVNDNDVFPEYLESGIFAPKPSLRTISNAMDVGNPSNLSRIQDLFGNDHKIINSVIFSRSYNDPMTETAIKEVFDKYGYLLDPHGAVGYLAIKGYLKKFPGSYNTVLLETAHPAKFPDVAGRAAGIAVPVPERLAICMEKEKKAVFLENSYEQFRSLLLS
jgi:threonine synthase